MTVLDHMQPWRLASAGVALAGVVVAAMGSAAMAQSQQVCVDCSGPAASYACSVLESDKVAHSRNSGRALEFICISELAKAGGHQSCRASRDFVGPCIGQPRLLDLSRPSSQSAVVTDPNSETEPIKPASTEPRPPETLEAVAREAVAKSQAQLSETDRKMKAAAQSAGAEIEKAGTAVGDVVKKSVGCLVTLFTKC